MVGEYRYNLSQLQFSFKTKHVCKNGLIDSEMVQTNKNKGNMKDYYASPENIS